MKRQSSRTTKALYVFFLWLGLLLPSLCLSNLSPPSTPTKLSAWDAIASNITSCLLRSDEKRDSGFDGSSTGWTSWVEEKSAKQLQQCLDRTIFDDDAPEDGRWLRWMKSSPHSMILECSEQLQTSVNQYLTCEDLRIVDQTREEFLSRIACRIIVLPSGANLQHNLRTAPGGMIYGKLLYGGVTRYRIIGKQRKAGERTLIASPESWLQYGGPERSYRAIDMGPCALLELILLPKGLRIDENNSEMMVVTKNQYNIQDQFLFLSPKEETMNGTATTPAQSQQHVNFHSEISVVLGGLENQIEAIVRRVLEGRALLTENTTNAAEMRAMLDLGLQPVKGVLLHGPPGCGKTALAREIARLLTERPPKIVSAPELLDRWVGGSEKLVRDLFGDAEAELQVCNGDLVKSGLHVIVIDEIDAVFRKRSSASDSGEVTRASAVNQILAKMDGVKALGNILVIGTTNRKELLDKALLRPGRLEVQMEIPLPDRKGRREILGIHLNALRRRGRLSEPLLQSFDDLAKKTKGFSGADIQGLVRCAGSLALVRARSDGSGIEGLLITLEDMLNAITELKR
jgi:vesicle-fusing ATPase